MALAIAVRSKALELGDVIVANIYELIDMALYQLNLSGHVGKYWLNITKISDRGDSSFAFVFSRLYIDKAISVLSRSTDRTISPVEMIFALILYDAPDTGVDSHQRGESSRIDMRFVDLKVLQAQPKLWHAERTMFGSEEASFKYVHEVKGYVLCLNSAPDSFEAVERAVALREDAIRHQLEGNLSKLQKRFKAIRHALGSGHGRAWAEIKDITTSIIAKLGVEIAKG